MTALVPKQTALTLHCPYPGVPFQSEQSDWLRIAWSLQRVSLQREILVDSFVSKPSIIDRMSVLSKLLL